MDDQLGNFGSSDSNDSQQQRTNIEFENPDHPDQSPAYTSMESAKSYFNAAVAAKDWPSDRKVLIGEFLLAVQDLHVNGDSDRLVQFMEKLTGKSITIEDD